MSRPHPINLCKVIGVSEETNLEEFLNAAEKWLISRRVQQARYNKVRAAQPLGLSLRQFFRILDKHGMLICQFASAHSKPSPLSSRRSAASRSMSVSWTVASLRVQLPAPVTCTDMHGAPTVR
jgi:hypothetical protein